MVSSAAYYLFIIVAKTGEVKSGLAAHNRAPMPTLQGWDSECISKAERWHDDWTAPP
jgi:hypothetical protein